MHTHYALLFLLLHFSTLIFYHLTLTPLITISATMRYLSHVVGHEGEGSLHSVLQSLGWVEELAAGPAQQ
jgi:secreted Zn-dependent insulinase-like peptidase